MDAVKRRVLRKYREKIVKDLEVKHILDELYAENVINLDDLEKIKSQTERSNRVRCLLDILPNKENEAYLTFANVLSKDYLWLSTELKNPIGCINETEYEEEIYLNALTLGDIPQLPHHYVVRTAKLNETKENLKRIKRGEYIVLHGMPGSGKSVLAVSAVRDPNLLREKFNNCMYFVNAGEAKNEMDIANLLYRLYTKLDDDYQTDFSTSLVFGKSAIDLLKDKLIKIFLNQNRREALLILDDVSSRKVISAFNFGCKTLITTRDTQVVPQNICTIVSVNKGFEESESLKLFSNCTGIKVEDLPAEAKTLHDLCKGAPLVIALIGSNLEPWKEDARNRDRWKYYINMLINTKDGRMAKALQMFFRRRRNQDQDYLFNTIKHCFDSLSLNYQDYYKHFALFVEDVNITPRVMEIVLGKSKYEVEEIVTELTNKSLIVCAYSKGLESYVYGIHDLLLANLKQILSDNELIKLHDSLVENYLKVSNNNFAELPNDNYIFTYIGYHLLQAERYEDFPSIYFDLNFIGAKIKAVGMADLVGDFKRYRKYITKNNDPELIEKLDTFETFVQNYGQDLHKYPSTDIIQCGLQQPVTSEVHKVALQIALKQSEDTLYLQTQFFGQTVYVTHTLDLSEEVCATCFARQTNDILVGTGSGEIHLWDHSYKRKLRTFTGHTQKVTYLQLSSDASKFLSVSEDGSVKVWSLENACVTSSGNILDENGFDIHTPSPRTRQADWKGFFAEPGNIDRSITYTIPGDSLTAASFSVPDNENDNEYLVVGSQKGVVKAWKLKTNQDDDSVPVFEVFHEGNSIICCTFSLRNSIILFSCENTIFLYEFETSQYLSQLINDMRTTSVFVVPYVETKIVAISDRSVAIWCWEQSDREGGGISVYNPYRQVLECREDALYSCGAVTWDGRYVFAGSSDHFIRMWDLHTGHRVKEMLEHNGLVMCLDTFLNEQNANVRYILLSGSDKTVKHWHIATVENQSTASKLLPEFSTYWKRGQIPIIAAINSENKIQVFNGHALISESEVIDQPKCVAFSPCGNEIAIGLNNGIIKIFDWTRKKYRSVMNLEGSVKYIEYLTDTHNVITIGNSNVQNGNNTTNVPNCDSTTNVQNNNCSSILVAASENTCLMAYVNKDSIRFKKPESAVSIEKGKVSRTIKCFYLPSVHCILSVEQDRSIKSWFLNGIKDVLVVRETNTNVTMATMSVKKDMIALTLSDGHFKIYELQKTEDSVKCIFNQGKKLDDIPRCCCFSNDGKLLALGQDSGNIVLWSIENKIELTTLKLHNSWVRNLIFSPAPVAGAPLVLVSVGDQIAWWNITYVWNKSTEKIRRSSRGRGSMRFSKAEELTIDVNLHNMNLIDSVWVGKNGQKNRPELLSAIKLAGVYAAKVAVSPTFTSFVTVDVSGLLYIMNVLKPD